MKNPTIEEFRSLKSNEEKLDFINKHASEGFITLNEVAMVLVNCVTELYQDISGIKKTKENVDWK